MPSRVAVCSWSLGARSPGALLAALDALDIRAVQLALNPLLDDPATWRSGPDLLRSAGVDIVSGMMAMVGEDYSTLESIALTGGVRADAKWPSNLARATRVANVAAEFGIELVSFHAGFLSDERGSGERRTMLDRLHLIADAFEPRGLRLALETGQESAATLIGVLEDLHRPLIGVNFDPANMILYGKGDPVQALRTLLPYVRQVHVKDALPTTTPGRWGTEVPAGTGAVDWPPFFKLAQAIEPPVMFVIEREAGGDRRGDIAQARDLIVKALRR